MTATDPGTDPRAVAGTRTFLLLGPDHPQLRELAAGGIDPGAGAAPPGLLGAAISAGWLPKATRAVEPNEDGVLLAAGPAGALVAVADGHGGSAAAVGALRALAARAPELLGAGRAELDGAVCATAFAAAAHAAVRATGPRGPERDPGGPEARTALSLVVVTGEAFFAVSYGDTRIVVVRRGRARRLGATTDFLGPQAPPDPPGGRRAQYRRRRPGDALVVVSDGVPDYLGRAFPAAVTEAVAGHAGDPVAAARALLVRASGAGAADNVTAAVLLGTPTGSRRRWPPRAPGGPRRAARRSAG